MENIELLQDVMLRTTHALSACSGEASREEGEERADGTGTVDSRAGFLVFAYKVF